MLCQKKINLITSSEFKLEESQGALWVLLGTGGVYFFWNISNIFFITYAHSMIT